MTAFDPAALLEVLHRHGVRYVLIGGLAAALHGSAAPTFDVDITRKAIPPIGRGCQQHRPTWKRGSAWTGYRAGSRSRMMPPVSPR